jgi:hypothetical protein
MEFPRRIPGDLLQGVDTPDPNVQLVIAGSAQLLDRLRESLGELAALSKIICALILDGRLAKISRR